MAFFMRSDCSRHTPGLERRALTSIVIGGPLRSGDVDYIAETLFGVLFLGIIQVLSAFSGTFSSWWTRIVVAALPLPCCLLRRPFVTRTPKKAPAAR